MEAVEGAAALSPVGERQGEAAGSEPPPIEHAERSGKREKALPSPPRGSSLRNFFSCSCDRPGCYEEFDRTRRSPLQRFCSHACRHALERVLERERRWRERRLEHERVKNSPGAWHPMQQ